MDDHIYLNFKEEYAGKYRDSKFLEDLHYVWITEAKKCNYPIVEITEKHIINESIEIQLFEKMLDLPN